MYALIFGEQQPAQGQATLGGSVAAAVFVIVFWAIGIGLLLAALHMARRRAAIAVAAGRLLVVQVGLFGEKKRVWEPDELRSIEVGPSGMEVNDRPVLELQFVSKAGDKFGLFGGRDQEEIEWLATQLGKALGLDRLQEGDAVVADVDTQPAGSNVVADDAAGR